MQKTGIWRIMLGVERPIVRDVDFDEESGVFLSMVGPLKSMRTPVRHWTVGVL